MCRPFIVNLFDNKSSPQHNKFCLHNNMRVEKTSDRRVWVCVPVCVHTYVLLLNRWIFLFTRFSIGGSRIAPQKRKKPINQVIYNYIWFAFVLCLFHFSFESYDKLKILWFIVVMCCVIVLLCKFRQITYAKQNGKIVRNEESKRFYFSIANTTWQIFLPSGNKT